MLQPGVKSRELWTGSLKLVLWILPILLASPPPLSRTYWQWKSFSSGTPRPTWRQPGWTWTCILGRSEEFSEKTSCSSLTDHTLHSCSLQPTCSQGVQHQTFSWLYWVSVRKISLEWWEMVCPAPGTQQKEWCCLGTCQDQEYGALQERHKAKVMTWVGIVDGKVLPVHWF